MDLQATGSMPASEVLRLAASAEAATRHPLADSVTQAAAAQRLDVPRCRDATTEPGAGVCAVVDGLKVWMPKITHSCGFAIPTGRIPHQEVVQGV